MPARSSRYSGSERPAWRMNQTGVCGTRLPRAARTRAESVWVVVVIEPIVSRCVREPISAMVFANSIVGGR